MMLQRKEKHTDKTGQYNIPAIITDSYDIAVKYVETDEQVTWTWNSFLLIKHVN